MKVEEIKKAAEMIRNAGYTVVLTGAGISVPSGIPDFRSPESGLWETFDPMEAASLSSFLRNPNRFYEWIRPLIVKVMEARPNPAHEALAVMQKKGYIREIITQNIDGLHEAAGADNVLPIHGHIRTVTCIHCKTTMEARPHMETVLGGKLPQCPACNGVLKPDVVMYGEMMPEKTIRQAQDAALNADLILVAGSSMEVFPANELPYLTLRNGGSALIVNQGPTMLDGSARLKIRDDVSVVLPALLDELLK